MTDVSYQEAITKLAEWFREWELSKGHYHLGLRNRFEVLVDGYEQDSDKAEEDFTNALYKLREGCDDLVDTGIEGPGRFISHEEWETYGTKYCVKQRT